MRTYDEILEDIVFENGHTVLPSNYFNDFELKIMREAAERYRAQVELPSDDEILMRAERVCMDIRLKPVEAMFYKSGVMQALNWMRDHISKQLKQGI